MGWVGAAASLAFMLRTLRSVLRFRRLELDARKRRLARAANVDDLRSIAQRRLPQGVFDYIDGGAEDEVSLSRNSGRFDEYVFSPRVLVDVSTVETQTQILGATRPLPLILSPTGFTRIADAQGELAVARAAARAGLPYTLSTLATRSIEEVAKVSGGPKWFQVYVWKDRGLVQEMIERAADAAYEAIVLTVDTAVLGRRERDVRRGFSLPPKIGLDTIWDGIRNPSWTWEFLRSEPIAFANVVAKGELGGDPVSLSEFVNSQFDQALSWDDIEWFRGVWKGPIVVKGVQSVEDAQTAQACGMDAIALSNHGGRQLDGAPTPVELISPVRQAVQDGMEIYCDGGIRRGSDIVKAIALGADACMIGRAYLYGLGAAGEPGVDFVLDHLAQGVERTLALTGRPQLRALDAGVLQH